MDQTFLTGGTPQTTYKNKPKVEAKESARPLSSDARSAVVSKLFEKAVDNKYGVRETFRMVVDLIYYALGRDEPHYMELVKQLEPRTVELATQIYSHIFEGLYYKQEIHDYLGDAYMYLSIGNARAGQYFTPWPVARMMAEMLWSKEEYEKAKAENRKLTLDDPCVGSGVMLLAWKAVIIKNLGIEGLDQYGFYGQDVDELMVHMCRIQMWLTDYRYMADLLIVTAYEMKELKDQGKLKMLPAPAGPTLPNTITVPQKK